MPRPSYKPGDGVAIFSSRLEVVTLQQADLDNSLEQWTGSERRNRFIWKPQISTRDYMSGLIQYCDNVRTFVFGIRAQDQGCFVGYRKVQILEEDNGQGPIPTAIPTTVIGEAWAGHAYGQEAGHAVNWFLGSYAGVQAISPRIYDANEETWRLVERMGYRLVRTPDEPQKKGPAKKVRHYLLNTDELAKQHHATYEQLTMRVR